MLPHTRRGLLSSVFLIYLQTLTKLNCTSYLKRWTILLLRTWLYPKLFLQLNLITLQCLSIMLAWTCNHHKWPETCPSPKNYGFLFKQCFVLNELPWTLLASHPQSHLQGHHHPTKEFPDLFSTFLPRWPLVTYKHSCTPNSMSHTHLSRAQAFSQLHQQAPWERFDVTHPLSTWL